MKSEQPRKKNLQLPNINSSLQDHFVNMTDDSINMSSISKRDVPYTLK